jgi:two-component sensor histidine kinase
LLLIDELNHRVKNTLAIVQSLAAQTLRDSDTSEDVREAFTMRLMALAQAHDMLTNERWQGANLREVIAQAASIQGGGVDRVRIAGPRVQLSPKMTLSLSMAMHELTTNALKYGALSNEVGYVEIGWTLVPRASGDWLNLCWKETGGPSVAPPNRRGFGSRLIESGLAIELAGEVKIVYEPAGVICTIVAPLSVPEHPG